MTKNLSRRDFVKAGLAGTATLAGPVIVPSSALGRDGAIAPSDRVTVGIVGAGVHGQRLMWGLLAYKAAHVVAVCDVYPRHLQQAKWKVNRDYLSLGCAAYADSSEITRRGDIDAVVIATPDHWHVLNALAAVKAGKSIYLEKPMSLSVAHGQVLRSAVRANKGVFQFGTQQRSHRGFRRAVELVRAGQIGTVREIEIWTKTGVADCAAPSVVPPPDGFDYDRWLGPAPWTPYTEEKCFDIPARKIRRVWSLNPHYSIGPIGFLGIHAVDIALWGCPDLLGGEFELDGRSAAPKPGPCETLGAWDVRMTFAGGVRLRFRGGNWDGPDASGFSNLSSLATRHGPLYNYGTVFVGTEGWLKVDRNGIRSFPRPVPEESSAYSAPAIGSTDEHLKDWIDSIRAGRETASPIEPSFRADLVCHLANIAAQLNRKLRFDPVSEKFVGDAEANLLLAPRAMRPPWGLARTPAATGTANANASLCSDDAGAEPRAAGLT